MIVGIVILLTIIVYTTFKKTSEEKNTDIVLIENVVAANQNVLIEKCVEQVKFDNPTLLLNQEINLTFSLSSQCWIKEISDNNLDYVEKDIRLIIEKYLRNLNNQVTNSGLTRNMLGQIYNTYRVKIKLLHPQLVENSASVEKAVQTIKWEAKWQKKP